MKKMIFMYLIFLNQLVSAKVADFNSIIQTQVNTEKEIYSSLNEEFEAIEISTAQEAKAQPEIIFFGAGVLPLNSADKNSNVIKNTSTLTAQKPIVIEEKQFVRLGEELSEAK